MPGQSPPPGAFHTHVHFETPENVRIGYPLAGAGTRFLAWLLDQIVVWLGTLSICFALLLAGVAAGAVEGAFSGFDPKHPDKLRQSTLYFIGVMLLAINFGGFLYFFACEFTLRGETIGKRLLGLRVVKANGFSLDPLSLFLRNIVRFVDHLPPLWIVPVLSRRTQRTGDMAAGTLVVSEHVDRIRLVRRELAGRNELDARFRFDGARLARLRPVDVEFVERLVDRWDEVPRSQLRRLLDRTIPPLAVRLGCAEPPPGDLLPFLEDLLAAEYRRRARSVA
jgi:uncharacterized RDD family membrane protein YckC